MTPTNSPGTSHVVDLAAELEDLPPAEAARVLADLPGGVRADVVSNLPQAIQAAVAGLLPDDVLAETVAGMSPDDRADLFNTLAATEQRAIMAALSDADRADLRDLAAYAEDSAGAIMTTAYAVLTSAMSAEQALDALRQQAGRVETIYRAYVLDEAGRLIGSVRLHALVLADAGTPVTQIMDDAAIRVLPESDREDVARLIARYDMLALPVTDADGRMKGIVTHDDATDAMQAETTEDFQKISTVVPIRQSLREAGIGRLYSRRIVWLALLVLGNLFSGAGIAYFEETILAHVALVFFLPLLIDSSGNAGSQSATLMVRALATGDVALGDWRRLIVRELAVAAGLGVTMAVVVFPVGALRGGVEVAMVVGMTMVLVVIVGSLVGMSLPFVLSRLRLDPATASGPLVTTISDAVGVVVYFSMATWVLAL